MVSFTFCMLPQGRIPEIGRLRPDILLKVRGFRTAKYSLGMIEYR